MLSLCRIWLSVQGRRQGNPFADSFTGNAEASPAAVELAAASATTARSTLPLLGPSQVCLQSCSHVWAAYLPQYMFPGCCMRRYVDYYRKVHEV